MRRFISSKGAALAAGAVLGFLASAAGQDYVDDAALKSAFEKRLGDLFRAGGLPPGSAIAAGLREAPATTELAAPLAGGPAEAPPLAEAIARARGASLVFGHLFHCGKCERDHANLAGGVLLSPDGLAVTNYHVLDFREAIVFGAMVADGRVFALETVLAASKRDDLALVRLHGAAGLPHVVLQPGLAAGEEVFVLSHPDGHFHTLTRGHLARRYLHGPAKAPRLQITADFAKGSSGSGIFNASGDLAGLAATTSSIYYNEDGDRKDNLQMVVKSGVPAEEILRLFDGPGPGSR